ncbi:MAG: hypothetical protein KKA79_03705 [Nanoarchaeota archaeon]|nr:hypothetical protein [Nanoarchaeota archaeon]MCG2717716.1 hypothetical protein [Nanoarchaeota archaeon]
MKIEDIGDKWLPETVFMHEKVCFIVEKQGLNSLKTMSFTVNQIGLAGGIKKDGRIQKTETKSFLEGKERENCSNYGEGDTL